jgi:hypothetical protein
MCQHHEIVKCEPYFSTNSHVTRGVASTHIAAKYRAWITQTHSTLSVRVLIQFLSIATANCAHIVVLASGGEHCKLKINNKEVHLFLL